MNAATDSATAWRRVGIPPASVLAARADHCDHVDSVRFELTTPITLDVALNILGAPMTGVVATLMRLRDGFVGRFGLKTSDDYRAGDPRHPVSCMVGERIGSFTIFERTPNEAIVGKNDRHLDFRVSMLVEGTAITMTTMVFFHNLWGRCYFAAIRPLHLTMVPRSYVRGLRRYIAGRNPSGADQRSNPSAA